MVDFRFWVAGNRAYAYTPHRQADSKFYAIVYAYDKKTKTSTRMIKKRPFARRKKAKECAYKWYEKRKAVLDKLRASKPVKPSPTKAEILEKKIEYARKKVKQLQTRIKRLTTALKKWQRRQKYYEKQLPLG